SCGFDGGRVVIGYSYIYYQLFYSHHIPLGSENFLIVYNLDNLSLERIFTIDMQNMIIRNIFVVKDYYFVEFSEYWIWYWWVYLEQNNTYLILNRSDFSIVKTFTLSIDNLLSIDEGKRWIEYFGFVVNSYVYYNGGYNFVQPLVVYYETPNDFYYEIIIYIDKYSDNFTYIGSEYYGVVRANYIGSVHFHYDGNLRILMWAAREYVRFVASHIALSSSVNDDYYYYLMTITINDSVLTANIYTDIEEYHYAIYYCGRWFLLLVESLHEGYPNYYILIFEFNDALVLMHALERFGNGYHRNMVFHTIYDYMVHFIYFEYDEWWNKYYIYEVREINLSAGEYSIPKRTTYMSSANNAELPFFVETDNPVMNSLTLSPIIEDKDVGLIVGSVAYYRTVNGYCCKIIQIVSNETATKPPASFPTFEINVLNVLASNQMILVLLFLLFFIPITRVFGVSRALSIASTVCAVISLMVGAYNVFSMFLVLSIIGFALWQSGY
ncbi:MAG: hypothetical protein QXR31_03975, partial [Zestosphaera sp.]